MKPNASRANELKSILDSDDEIPDSYEDTPEIPAYLNDARFHQIQLPWLDNCNPIKISKTPPARKTTPKPIADDEANEEKELRDLFEPKFKDVEEPMFEKDEQMSEADNHRSKIVISRGVLTARDLFFVKTIEEYCSESTLLWFIESLKNKAFTNRPQVSCLAGDICHDSYRSIEFDSFDAINTNYYFNLRVGI